MTIIALHLKDPNTPQAQANAANPNNAANLISKIMASVPGTDPNTAAAAAISGQIHASNFPATLGTPTGTLHVDTTTGVVTPHPLGTPAPGQSKAIASIESASTGVKVAVVAGVLGLFALARKMMKKA